MDKTYREMPKKQSIPPWFSLRIGSLVPDLSQSTKFMWEATKIEKITNPLKPELIKHYLYVVDGEKKARRKTKKKDQKKSEEEKHILCIQCENKISRSIYRMNHHQGAFDHTFLNPAGDVFHIGCFKRADGCVVLGKPSREWTWFQGCQWQVAVCSQCLKHLGWYYQSEKGSSFFGLILDALI